MYYIGIDLGTSAVKLLLMDEKGGIKATVSESYDVSYPKEGWSEQNPYDWYTAVTTGLKALTKDIERSDIAGISFGGQMHGLVILDENDNVIRPAILWNDGRTAEESDYLNNVIGTEKLVKYTGNISFAGFTAPKILWLKKNEPENFEKIRKIMLPKDYIAYRLTGVFSTDYSDASGMLLLDVENKKWSEEMLEICGISENQLPTLYESSDKIGTLLPNIAEELDFPKTVIVAAGAGDNAAAAVGTGTVGEGGCNISLGTSGTFFVSGKNIDSERNPAIHYFAHADGGFHLMGCILSAASCNRWWMEDIIGTDDYNSEQEKITELGNNNVYFLPYLMGERSPHNDTSVRGSFIGLSAETTRADMTQAVLEGVAFAIRDCFEAAVKSGIKIENAKICGGGAKSELWKKIFANVIGIRIDSAETEEGPSYGAAILAAVANGEYKDVEEAAKSISGIKASIYPDSEIVQRYNKKYEKFVKIYPAVRDLYR